MFALSAVPPLNPIQDGHEASTFMGWLASIMTMPAPDEKVA
jgi:hypothetical protein